MRQYFGDDNLLDFDDQPMLINGAANAYATPRRIVYLALTSSVAGDDKQSGEVKHKLWKLAKRVKKAQNALELTVEDLATIKERVASMFAPLVSGQMFDLIEGVEDEPNGTVAEVVKELSH